MPSSVWYLIAPAAPPMPRAKRAVMGHAQTGREDGKEGSREGEKEKESGDGNETIQCNVVLGVLCEKTARFMPCGARNSLTSMPRFKS